MLINCSAEDDLHKYFESFWQNYLVSIRCLHNPPTSLYISFYRGSQYGLRNEKSAYLNHLLHDNTDNLQELNRKGVFFQIRAE